MSKASEPGLILALIDHPNLDLLLGPVLVRLQERGHDVKALVVEAGRPDRLQAMGVPLVRDNHEFDLFLAAPRPRLLLNGADMIPQHRLGIHADIVCRGSGVPTLTLEHAPFSLSYDGSYPPHVEFAADRMAVIGPEDLRQYLARGIPPERLVVTGCPAFDPLVIARRDHHPQAPPRDVAVFGQSHTWTGPGSGQGIPAAAWRDELEQLFRVLCERFPEARLRIKPHPAEPFAGTEVLYHQAVPAELAGRIEILPTDADNARVILQSRLVVSFSSTIWLEARILGRACAFFTLQERRGRLARDIPALGGIWIPGKTVDFTARLRPHLDELAAREPEGDRPPDPLLVDYTGPLDGLASAHVAEEAERLLAEGPPQVPMPLLVFDGPTAPPRRLWPDRTYPDYVHLQAVAEEAMQAGGEQPFVLALVPEDSPLGDHLPLAQLTRCADFPARTPELPYPDRSFDAVAAPDLWTLVGESGRAAVLDELKRVARKRIVTSLPTRAGLQQYGELRGLLEWPEDYLPAFAAGFEPELVERWLHETAGKLRLRPCHQVMSWAQALLLEQVGLDEGGLRSVRSSLQATGFGSERQGRCARTVCTIILDD